MVDIARRDLDRIFARCEGAYSEITLRGYRNDLTRFRQWCSDRGHDWLPADPANIAGFVDHEVQSKTISTVRRRVEAIKFAHRMSDLPSPANHSDVMLALRRAGRAKHRRPKQALGLTSELLEKIAAACPDTLAGKRDAALVSVGYDTLCRSAELAAMMAEHLAADLTTICVPRSKADPFGDGRIAYLSPTTIERLAQWLDGSGITEGPLFRGLHTAKLSSIAMETSSIRRLIKCAARRAGFGEDAVRGLSGHSMRVGAAQDMMVAGISTIGIMQAGGWRTFHVLARYVENASAEKMHQFRWERLGMLAAV